MDTDWKIPASRPPAPPPPSTMDSSVNAFPKARPMHGRTSGPTRRSTRGQWTNEEDEILRAAVERFKGKNWKKIADCFKDRTDVQCLHRWQKVLNPELIKGPWTKEEDEIIVQLVKKYGPKKWSTLAQHLPGRIGKQCRERWHNHLNPDIKKEAWTQEEEIVLIHAHQMYGNKWAELTKYLPGRTDNAIKNHWNSSVKKKIDWYKASGLLAQFPGLPSVIHQNQSRNDGDENSENSQVGCSQTQSDMSNTGFLTSEDFVEESEQGKMQSTTATPSCSEQYYNLDDMTFTIPDIPCEFTISSDYLEDEFLEDVGSNPRDCNFGVISSVDCYIPTTDNDSDPNVAQHTLKPEEDHSLIKLPIEDGDMERCKDYMSFQSVYQLSTSVLEASRDEISGENGLTMKNRKFSGINEDISNNDNSSSIPSGIPSQSGLTVNEKKFGQINPSSLCHDPSNTGVTEETDLLDSLRLVSEDKFISELSDDQQRTPPRIVQEAGTLCYEPPRFPSLDVPFFSCDLAQSGTDAQQDFSPFGIRHFMLSSASSLTPFKLWDSPSSDDSPDAVLKSAAKTFSCMPSILKKRNRDLLSPLSPFSEKQCDRKKGNGANQGFLCPSRLTKEFSCLDVLFDETVRCKEFASSSNDPIERLKVSAEEDKENVCPAVITHNQEVEARIPEKETPSANCKALSYEDCASEMCDSGKLTEVDGAKKPRGVLVERHSNDPALLSPVGIRPSKVGGFKSDSDLPFGEPGFFFSPPSFDRIKRNYGSEVSSSSGQPVSAVTTVMVDSLANEIGSENLNFFGGTPFRRSLESPPEWNSPWCFSSLVSGPGFEPDITIEDIGIFMSPGERSFDAIGLMKQINNQGADTYADAREVLGTETPETILRQRCSKKLNLKGESSDVSNNNPLKGRLHTGPTFMTERRVLDFSECGTPVKSKEKKCGGASGFSSPSLLKGFR